MVVISIQDPPPPSTWPDPAGAIAALEHSLVSTASFSAWAASRTLAWKGLEECDFPTGAEGESELIFSVYICR